MKLLHYTRTVERGAYGIEEYIVLTEADEDGERNFEEVCEAFRRDEYELAGIHDVEPAQTCKHALPLEREMEGQ